MKSKKIIYNGKEYQDVLSVHCINLIKRANPRQEVEEVAL